MIDIMLNAFKLVSLVSFDLVVPLLVFLGINILESGRAGFGEIRLFFSS